MKILALIGSYRKHGNTALVVRQIIENMQEEARHSTVPLEVEILFLGDKQITPCHGCRTCFDRGEMLCPLKDDLQAIKTSMDQADGILMASPVYVDDVSGLIKNWLDRLAYLCHRPGLAGKSACLVATVGSSPTRRTLRTMATTSTWGLHIAAQAGFKCGALLKQAEMDEALKQKAAKTARQFFSSIRQEKPAHPSFLSLMIFHIQQLSWLHSDPTTYDYQFWNDQGWLDSRCNFYISQHAGWLKIAAARLLGRVIYPFVAG